jgi:hypothetical protein
VRRFSVIEIDPEDLERAFGHPVPSYEVEPIDPHLRIHSVTGGVYRVRADAGSLVIKVVRHGADATPNLLWQAGTEVAHRNYWKREWLAFDSGLLDSLPGHLRAPRTLLTTQPHDDECWIWMEDVKGRTGEGLHLDDYPAIAHALGSTQGAFASGAVPLPDEPWLSRHWLRGWVDTCAQFVEISRDDDRWDDPRLASLERLRPRVSDLWDRRAELLAIAEEPALTITHWDFWPANLAVGEDIVAVDWSQIGLSGVGHDLDQLTLDTVWMHVRPDESVQLLDDLILPAYLDGLHESGFDVTAQQLHRWYSAAAALRYAWLGGGHVELLENPDRVRFQEGRFGRDITTITVTKSRVTKHALDLGERVLAG